MTKQTPPDRQLSPAENALPVSASESASPASQPEFALSHDDSAKERLDHVVDSLKIVLALAWAPKGQTLLLRYLHCLQLRHAHGAQINHAEMRAALDHMERQGLVVRSDAGIVLSEPLRTELGNNIFGDARMEQFRTGVFEAENFLGRDRWGSVYFNSLSQAKTVMRLALYSGSAEQWQSVYAATTSRYGMDAYAQLLGAPFDAALWERVQPSIRDTILSQFVWSFFQRLDKSGAQYLDWAIQRLQADWDSLPDDLRYPLIEVLLIRGEFDKANALLVNDESEFADLLRTALHACTGEWERAEAGFEALEKPLKAATASRKNYMSARVAWLYPMCLIALGGPQRLAKARRFCLSEQGKRQPEWDEVWGPWGMVLTMRLGDAPPDYSRLLGDDRLEWRTTIWTVQRYLLRAWTGQPTYTKQGLATLTERIAILANSDCHYLCSLLQSCLNVATGKPPLPAFFFPQAAEPWRDALASIAALDTTTLATRTKPAAKAEASRLLWDVAVAKNGQILGIKPWRQNRNARGDGWNKATPVVLATLAKSEKLDSPDAALARHIRIPRYGNASTSYIDLAGAAPVIIAHPRVILNGDISHLVRISEGQPALEVEADEKNGCWKFVLLPCPPSLAPVLKPATRGRLHEDDEEDDFYPDVDDERYDSHGNFIGYMDEEMRAQNQRNNLQCLVVDAPDAARLIRFSPAHMRVAQIIANDLKVPLTAKAELAAAMQALATHFELRSETALMDAARMLPTAESLRAEITPTSSGLALRLVVAPFDGCSGKESSAPARFVAGVGRSRVVMKIGGETVGVERDLGKERSQRDQVIAGLDSSGVAWEEEFDRTVTSDPESSLKLLEVLAATSAVAGIDWPKGKPITVTPISAKQARFVLNSKKEWFTADATLQIDEKQVMRLGELLPLLANGPSRFLQLAPDRYLALTVQLRRQLDDLAALADLSGKGGEKDGTIKLIDASAMWLAQEIEDWDMERDTATVKRIAALRAAFAATPPIPAGLQATLRDYQIEGVCWLQRLGAAGFGACLADDMGLGKTVQTLALLLDRAGGGPALVIAPTSLIGNWAVEAARFAPSLRVRIYGETVDDDGRRSIVESAMAGEVVLCTYSLMQMAKELFAAKPWHTIVLDEAQAVKNAMAQRTQAVFALQGGFRLALSGTPVENRLEELWSIMRFLNPGLLGTSEQFARRFVTPIAKEQAAGVAAADSSLRRLKRLIAPFLLRRTKAAVLTDLPERTEMTLRAELDTEERSHYELLRRRAETAIQEGATDNTQRFKVLAELMRLRRAACDPRLVHKGWPSAGAKVRLFTRVAQDLVAGGHRTLVFSQFTDYLALLGKALEEMGFDYQYLDGSTPGPDRNRRVAAFQEGAGQFFLISLKAGGYGLNLTAADYVIIADPWWNPAAEDQAMGRAHRIGQRRPVTAYRLVAADTIEDRIVELHASKRALADGLLEGGDRAGAVASVDELLALLRGE